MAQIMSTETLLVRFSARRAFRTSSPESTAMINTLRDNLNDCLWSIESLTSTGVLSFLFVPSVDGGTAFPKRVVGCGGTFLIVGSATFVLYDPGREVPATVASCIFVAMATSQNGTMDNLVASVEFNTNFYATADHTAKTITFESKTGGPESNFTALGVDTRYGFASSQIQGGGFKFKADAADSYYEVRVQAFAAFSSPIIRFSFTFSTGTAQFDLATGTPAPPDSGSQLAQYKILSNPHGFVFMNGENRQSSLMAAAPMKGAGTVYGVFVIGPFQLPVHTYANASRVTCINTLQGTGGSMIKFLQFRCAGETYLSSPNGKSLYSTAYVSYSANTSEGGIVGTMYDCVMCSDVVQSADPTALSAVMIDGVKFVAIAQQTGAGGETRGTLLMAIPDPSRAPKTGTANMFGAGVTRLSGDPFTADMVGKVITISGYSGVIDTVTDSDHLTLTQPIAIVSGGSWVIA